MAQKSKAALEREAAAKAKDELPERETYTAKQVATRCGTDAKTLRKFLRSSHSSAEAVGQGGRYEFDAADLPLIQREFKGWRKKAEARRSSPIEVTEPIPKKPRAKQPQPKHKPRDPNRPDPIQDAIDKVHREAKAKYDPPAEPDPDDDDIEPTAEELAELEDDLPEVDFATHDPNDPHGIGGW